MTQYYVYSHIDPETDDIVYLGHGQGSRAWQSPFNRSKEHNTYLKELLNKGFLPEDWVLVLVKGLSKSEACELERGLIEEHKPIFNKKNGIRTLKFNKDQVLHMKALRRRDFSYSRIAEIMGCSPMVAHRILTGNSPRYKEMLIDK